MIRRLLSTLWAELKPCVLYGYKTANRCVRDNRRPPLLNLVLSYDFVEIILILKCIVHEGWSVFFLYLCHKLMSQAQESEARNIDSTTMAMMMRTIFSITNMATLTMLPLSLIFRLFDNQHGDTESDIFVYSSTFKFDTSDSKTLHAYAEAVRHCC